MTALKLIQKHETLEKVLASMRESKYQIPDPFPFEEARRLFKGAHHFPPSAAVPACCACDNRRFCHAEPDVLRGEKVQPLKWVAADEEGLVKFLVGEKSFNEDRVRKAVQRINAAKSKSTQGDLCSLLLAPLCGMPFPRACCRA